ncbi:MAG: DUF5678 domain-containing protein [Candidatus Micrarchaeia archaeon]
MDNYDFFLKTDLSEHMGEWVAIVDQKIVASGKSFKKVYAEARKFHPDKTPFLSCVPDCVVI